LRDVRHGVFTGVPFSARQFKRRLREDGISYVLVAQAEYPSRAQRVERIVVEVFSRTAD